MEAVTTRPFTTKTRLALAIARGIAAARGDRDLTPAHIAVGILREGSNTAIGALWYAGLSEAGVSAVRFDLEQSLGDAPGRIPPRQVTIDLTPGEEDVVRLGDIEAGRIGDPFLGAEHILLAVLRSDEAVARRFAEHGVSPEQYDQGLTSVRRGDPPPDHANAV